MGKQLQENETVFSHSPEIKLSKGRLTVIRLLPGEDCTETEGLRLHRLSACSLRSGRLILKGDFFRETSLSSLRAVHEKDARPCRRTLRLPRELQNEDVLRRYLEEELQRSAEIPPFTQYEIFTEWAKHTLGWLSALLVVPCALVYALVSGLVYASAKGTLEGFREINGAHYPNYRFTLPDGTRMEKTEQAVSLEDSVTEEEASRILRRKYPRPVSVQYKRKDPEKSSCQYL